MERGQEEIQFLGFLGIIKESCRLIWSWRKIFIQITLTLILPLSFVDLAHIKLSEALFGGLMPKSFMLDLDDSSKTERLHLNVLTWDWVYYILFKAAYLLLFAILALLSTSAVVYAVACIYTAKEVTFKKVIGAVPNVWKRVMVTFVWNFIIVFAYNAASVLIFVLLVIFLHSTLLYVFMSLFLVAYVVGLFYITVVWHLASVVSVLEERYGIQAMYKSRALIRGKMGTIVSIFLALIVLFLGIQLIFEILAMQGGVIEAIGSRIAFGFLALVLMSVWVLFGLVSETIIYFICKSHHRETIDKSLLSNHLEGYLGDYVRLKSKDVQLQQFDEVV